MQAPPPENPPLTDVAIIGGGAAGALAAIHLLRADRSLRVRVVEPGPSLGAGVAYATGDPGHLLNVTAGGMSAFADDPDHFVRYLREQGLDDDGRLPLAARFVPRMFYGRYLRDTLAACTADGSSHLRDEAVDVAGSGPYAILLASGRVLHAWSVVLATGNAPRGLPVAGGDAATGVAHAWDWQALSRVPPDADVCIVGSGLSMADAVVSLACNGHRGRIRVLSRHGLMPLSHAGGRGPAGEVDALLPLGLRDRLRTLRTWAAADAAEGRPWQWTMDRLRPHGTRLWRSLGEVEQRRFLRHAQRYWDIHRHRIAPAVAGQLDALRATGRLDIHAGRLLSISSGTDRGRAGGLDIAFRPRGRDTVEHLRADRVFACTGIETRLSHMPSRLPAALAARGMAVAGPHGRGLATDADGALVSTGGHVQPHLLAVGSARIGQLWESTAVPELRVQAAALAGRLTAAS